MLAIVGLRGKSCETSFWNLGVEERIDGCVNRAFWRRKDGHNWSKHRNVWILKRRELVFYCTQISLLHGGPCLPCILQWSSPGRESFCAQPKGLELQHWQDMLTSVRKNKCGFDKSRIWRHWREQSRIWEGTSGKMWWQNIMPGSAEGQSYLGKAYLDSWGSLTPCLGMYGLPGARGEVVCLLRPSRLEKRNICSFSGRHHSRRMRMEPGRSKLPRGQETGGARLVRCGSHPLDFLDYWYKNLPHPLICIRGKARHFSFLDDWRCQVCKLCSLLFFHTLCEIITQSK